MSEFERDSVERTLCIPLWSRAIAVKKLPYLMPDRDAVRILNEMGEKKPPTVFYNLECAALAGAMRQYDFACEIDRYLKEHPDATVVELGAGMSCLRRQMKNDRNPWFNIDFPDVIRCREKYIPSGQNERNIVSDITDLSWFDKIQYFAKDGIIILAAGVRHYLTSVDVKRLIDGMARRFPRGRFVFDYVSDKGASSGNHQIKNTGNETEITFALNDAVREIPLYSDSIDTVETRSYLEGYPVSGAKYSLLTKLYIKSKRDKYYIAVITFKG